MSPAFIPRLRQTVAVADMVGYGSIARILEENMDANAVAELNRQIQTFIGRALSQLPDGATYRVVAKTGDGMIALFDRAEDAHCFGLHLHTFTAAHNKLRSESTAERWFRVGIATGEVAAEESPHHATEYAGTVIASAVRLESAATAGEIVIDAASFSALPQELQRLYGAEEIVKGKHKETFRARRFRVATRAGIAKASSLPRLGRRAFLWAGATAIAASLLGGWLERERIYRWTHPLPDRRHVALLAWPPGPAEANATLARIIGSIRERLSRAEAYVENLVIVTAEDMVEARTGGARKTAAEPLPQDTADQWGANLILAARIVKEGALTMLELRVLDVAEMRLLREHKLTVRTTGSDDVSRAAPESAARLLDLPIREVEMSDDAELARMSPAVRKQYLDASYLAGDLNGAKLAEAIEQFQELVEKNGRFALAYAGLGNLYLMQFERTHEAANIEIAAGNLRTALNLNPSSEKAQLGQAKYLLDAGQPDAALVQLAAILRSDPGNSAALFFKARVYSQLNRPSDEEEAYQSIIKNRPNFWYAYNSLGSIFHDQGNNAKAAEYYKTASVLAPKAATPLINLGVVYLDQGRTAEARAAFEKSNRIAEDEMAYEFLGTMSFQDKNFNDALTNYLHAEALNPRNHEVLSDLGDCYEKLKQPQKVKEYYARAAALLSAELKINPNQGPLWMTLAFYEAKIGDNKSAEADILNAERHDGIDVETSFTKARALAVMGQTREAQLLVIHCLEQGLSPVEVELASELDGVRSSKPYLAQIKK